jgi:hypothetical protein
MEENRSYSDQMLDQIATELQNFNLMKQRIYIDEIRSDIKEIKTDIWEIKEVIKSLKTRN